jgi:hypothetical protein
MKTIKEALIGCTTTLAAYVNDTQIVPKLAEEGSKLVGVARDLDHLLAGIGAPLVIGLVSKSLEKSLKLPLPNKFLTYATIATYWESKQFLERGYFQVDQFISDMVGLSISYSIDKFILSRDKSTS